MTGVRRTHAEIRSRAARTSLSETAYAPEAGVGIPRGYGGTNGECAGAAAVPT
jgi:hypothetical protein